MNRTIIVQEEELQVSITQLEHFGDVGDKVLLRFRSDSGESAHALLSRDQVGSMCTKILESLKATHTHRSRFGGIFGS